MGSVRTIEVDAQTADLLEARAAALGLTITALISDMACNTQLLAPELADLRVRGEGPWSNSSLSEDRRRLAEFERARVGVPWAEVKAWMQSWGKPDEQARPDSREL